MYKKHKPIGWIPDHPDHRDFVYAISIPLKKKVVYPDIIDLRSKSPGIYDQQDLNSCVGNSVGGVYQFIAMKLKLIGCKAVPSRLFVY
jgi:hypothetical protein